jgi:hypothetical protein
MRYSEKDRRCKQTIVCKLKLVVLRKFMVTLRFDLTRSAKFYRLCVSFGVTGLGTLEMGTCKDTYV